MIHPDRYTSPACFWDFSRSGHRSSLHVPRVCPNQSLVNPVTGFFKELLAQALDSSGAVDLDEIEAQIYQPKETVVQSNGNDVSLETEVGEMVKNSLHHKAYIRLLQKKYQQLELAIDVK